MKYLAIFYLISGLLILFIYIIAATKTKNHYKALAWTRWAAVYIVITPLEILCILFPLAWLMRSWQKWNPLWFILDDSRILLTQEDIDNYGFDIWDATKAGSYLNDYKIFVENHGYALETFWIALKWHVKRNRLWNLKDLIGASVPYQPHPEGGNNYISNVEQTIKGLYKIDSISWSYPFEYTQKVGQAIRVYPITQDSKWEEIAGLKYVGKEGQDIWQIMNGDEINVVTSRLGTGLMYYTPYDTKFYTFRYSQCKAVSYLWGLWKGWRTIKAGTGPKGYRAAWKHQKFKPWNKQQPSNS